MPASRCKVDGCDEWAATNKDYCVEHLYEMSAHQNFHSLSARHVKHDEWSCDPDHLIHDTFQSASFFPKVSREPFKRLDKLRLCWNIIFVVDFA